MLPQADGPPYSLVVAGADELAEDGNCRTVSTGLPVDAVTWLGAVASSELDSDARIALTERAQDRKILTIEVDPAERPIERRLLVPRAELLPVLSYRVFGREERVQAWPDAGAFEIVCRSGRMAAGAVLDLGDAAPATALLLELQSEADDGFSAQVVSVSEEARSRGVMFPSGDSGDRPLTIPVDRDGPISLVITCPEAGGRLRLKRVTVSSATRKALDRPSAWVWEPEAWTNQPAELLEAAAGIGLGRLYISVPISNGKVSNPVALGAFIAAARNRSISVSAVEGDPDMIAGEGRAYALERARALAAYNAAASERERLDGIQYDIEPYLGAGYAARSGVAWRLWAEALGELRAAISQKIDAVVPYWMLENPAARAALEEAAPNLDRLTIMAYRTDPAAIVSAAGPLLAWSVKRGVKATIGLEVGKLAPERRRVYLRATEGDLHVIRFDDVAAVVLLDRVRPGSPGRAYRLSHTIPSDVSRVSFGGNTGAALAAAAEVAPDVAAWPSVRNFAFHGLSELSTRAAGAPPEPVR